MHGARCWWGRGRLLVAKLSACCLHVFPWPGVIIHRHLNFSLQGLNDGGDVSVLAMNKKLMEAQRPQQEHMEWMMRERKYISHHLIVYTREPMFQ